MKHFLLLTLFSLIFIPTVAFAEQSDEYNELTVLENALVSGLGQQSIISDNYLDSNKFIAKVIRLFPLIERYSSDQAEVLRLNLALHIANQKKTQYRQQESVNLKIPGSVLPPMTAKAFTIYDPNTSQVLLQKNQNEQRSIASISKLVTAIVALDMFPVDQKFVMSQSAKTVGSASPVAVGENFNLSQGITYLLTRSANDVANQIRLTYDAQNYTGAFVQQMNSRVRSIGLAQTIFNGPSGLENANKSTAYELALLVDYISNNYPVLLSYARQPAVLRSGQLLESTNPVNMVTGEISAKWLGGNNGYISASGRTMALLFEIDSKPVIVTVLGSVLNDDGQDTKILLGLLR